MNYYQTKILQDLFESVDGLQPYTFYSRYKLKPEVMFQHIDELVNKGLITIKNNSLQINENGKNQLKSKNSKKRLKDKFENIPSDFIDEKLKINSFYIPNISYIGE